MKKKLITLLIIPILFLVTLAHAKTPIHSTEVDQGFAKMFNRYGLVEGIYWKSGHVTFENDIGSGGTWGSISGTLSNQTDLQNSLNAMLPKEGGTITGNLEVKGSVNVGTTTAPPPNGIVTEEIICPNGSGILGVIADGLRSSNFSPTNHWIVNLSQNKDYQIILDNTGVGTASIRKGSETVNLMKLSQIQDIQGTETVYLTGTNTETPLYQVTLPPLGSETSVNLSAIWLGSSTASIGTTTQTLRCYLALASNPAGSTTIFTSLVRTVTIVSHVEYLDGYFTNRGTTTQQVVKQWNINPNLQTNSSNVTIFRGINTGTDTVLTITGQLGTSSVSIMDTMYLESVKVVLEND